LKTDACGIASVTIDKSVFECTDVGANTVVVTATDVNDNIASTSVYIVVEDDTAPTVEVHIS
jgi:uncharacterized UPF0146 family protein